MKKIRVFLFTILVLSTPSIATQAAVALPPISVTHAIAYVLCDNRQGSGAITKIGPTGTYIVTVGHVVLDTTKNNSMPSACRIGLIVDDTLVPRAYYHATVIRATFDQGKDLDFAILQLGPQISGFSFTPTQVLRTNELAQPGESVIALGYPSAASDGLALTAGKILNFRRGSVLTNTPISPGYSGGPVIDQNNNLIGLATRVSYSVSSSGAQRVVDYEMGDILGLINWLDTFGSETHDLYITHATNSNYDRLAYVIRPENPPCLDLARTAVASTVYCILADSTRFVFPNSATYFSWYPDYSGVLSAAPESLASLRLAGNVTMKPGTLVKIQTDPKVYLVANSIGLLRAIPSEQRASALFEPTWARQIVDVPDTFFVNYTVGAPVQQ